MNNLNIPDAGATVLLKTIPYSGVRITKGLLVPQYTRAGKDRQPSHKYRHNSTIKNYNKLIKI